MAKRSPSESPIPIAASVDTGTQQVPCPCGSGRVFVACHGAEKVVPPPVMAPDGRPRKLDLACGQTPREGFQGVDLLAAGAERMDLLRFPWPWADDSVDELHCSHFCEHIPARNVEARDLVDVNPMTRDRFEGQDMFFAFFDEAYRVLKNGALFTVVVPALQSVRAFMDPTHRRFIPQESFLYLSLDWRKLQKLDHYRVRCDFGVDVGHTIPSEFGLFAPEVQARKFQESWNVVIDWHAKLVAKKGGPPVT